MPIVRKRFLARIDRQEGVLSEMFVNGNTMVDSDVEPVGVCIASVFSDCSHPCFYLITIITKSLKLWSNNLKESDPS